MNGTTLDKHPCSECGTLIPANRKTCGDKCRSKRSRRIKRERVANLRRGYQEEHQQAIAAVVQGKAPDVANELMKEELRPIVRDAITGEVLNSLRAMVSLAPSAIAALAVDLQSDDPGVRQKAYTLWFQYTVGQKNLHSPEAEDAGRSLVVNFEMPRPSDDESVPAEGVIEEAEELRVCDVCRQEKPAHAFVAASTRCQECHDGMVSRVASLLSEDKERGR